VTKGRVASKTCITEPQRLSS